MRFKILLALGVAFVMAAVHSTVVKFSPQIIILYFVIYGMFAVGGLLVINGGIVIFPAINFGRGSRARRPNRSKGNELGSGDMASRVHAEKWLKPQDENDTTLVVSDLRGSEPLSAKNGKLYIPGEERNRHVLFIAKTGSGKTTKAILPILYSDCLSKQRSTVVIDSKPEMWDKLAEMTHTLNPEKKILLFNPLDRVRSLSWNILSKVEDDTDAKLIANTLIMATDNPTAKSDSPFFRNNALSLLNALMVGLVNDGNEVLSMPRVHELINSGKEELCDWLEVHPAAIRNSKTFVDLARSGSQNADTILSELGMRLAAWDLTAIRSTTFYEELDLKCLVEEPTLFIIEFRESEIEMLRPMANVIVIEILRYLTKLAERYPGQKLPRPVGFVIDEFASALGRLPDIHVKLNTLRSRNVSIVAAIQSIAQIKANYDKDADSVLAGFSSKILMPMLDFQDAEWASKETGTMTIRFKTQTSGTNRRVVDAFAHRNKGENEQVQQRAVLTPDEIGRPIDNCATFFMPNTPVFQGHLVPYYKLKEMSKAIAMGEGNFMIRDKPIQYEEKLPDAEELKARQREAKAAAMAAEGGGAIGAIDPAQMVIAEPTPEELQAKLMQMRAKLDWDETVEVAKEWWEAFEQQNAEKLNVVVALMEELANRKATITEFFLAYLYSNEEDIEGNLAYLDKMKSELEADSALMKQQEAEADLEPEDSSEENTSEDLSEEDDTSEVSNPDIA